MKRKKIGWIALGLCAAFVAGALAYDGLFAKIRVTQAGFSMGSPVEVTATAPKRKALPAADAAVRAVNKLDSQISAKSDTSEISRINSTPGSDLQAETVSYIKRTIALSWQTGGAFDITVGALSRLWGFDEEQNVVPDNTEIQAALATVGYRKIRVEGSKVAVPDGTLLDLGAAGKGLACEKAMEALEAAGADSGIVTVGGSVGVYGAPVQVGIRNPFGSVNTSFATVNYSGAVASTSGIYEKHFLLDGVNYHHLLDPATGYPVQNDLVSVTVISPDGLASDALATACFLLDSREAAVVLDLYKAMAVLVYEDQTVQVLNERYPFALTDRSFHLEAPNET